MQTNANQCKPMQTNANQVKSQDPSNPSITTQITQYGTG